MSKLSGRLRIAVLERDGYRCVYCGRTSAEVALQVDHVEPRSAGGSDDATNLAAACFDCNNGKRANIVALPAHVTLAPIDLPDRRGSGYLRPKLIRPEGGSWLKEADRRYPDDKDLAWISGDGRWASVAWCAGLTVRLHADPDAARSAVAAIDRTGCGHGCVTWNRAVPPELDYHQVIDLAMPEVMEEDIERMRGDWRAKHFWECPTCRYLSDRQGPGAAVERMSMRCIKAGKQDRMRERARA